MADEPVRTSEADPVANQKLKQAQRKALDDMAKRGITGFTDTAGRQWRLDAYAEMATRTAVGRAQVAGTLARLRAQNMDLVIVSDHRGACKVCAPWESKVLSISGVGFPHTAKTGDGKTVKVAGSIVEAHSAGLQHPTCRHSLTAFIPGLTTPPPPRDSPTDGNERRATERKKQEAARQARRQEAARTGKAPKPTASGGAGSGKPPARPPTPTFGDDSGDDIKPGAWEAARQIRVRMEHIEERVTGDVVDVARAVGGRTARLDTKFKELESIGRKLSLKTRLDQVGITDTVDDALRYTIVLDDIEYVTGYRAAIIELRAKGFEIERDSPTRWRPTGYKGINVKVTDRSGETFEVQFQTPDSLQASDDTHGWYEEWRKADTQPERKAELERLINERYALVSIPPGMEQV